jgi:hypothetical protein
MSLHFGSAAAYPEGLCLWAEMPATPLTRAAPTVRDLLPPNVEITHSFWASRLLANTEGLWRRTCTAKAGIPAWF